jgi:O-antigen/teichoic acid export membrane protein
MERRPATVRWWSMGERGRRIAHASSWSLVAKASAAAHLFLSVPFVLAALGPARFGAWATLVALVAFAGFLDFGVGNGAMNLVAAAHGRGAKGEIATILREARRTLLQVAAWLLVAILVAGFLAPWHRVLGMQPEMADECRAAVLVVLVSIAVSVPLNLANRVQLGLGRGERTFRWQAIGQWLALAAVILAANAHPSLAVLTAAAVSTPLIASAINSWQLWRKLDVRDAPVANDADRHAIQRAIRVDGMAFFGLQLSAALAFSADLPLISALDSAREAGQYAIAQRLFSVVPLTLSLVWAPLWPIYRHALAGGDMGWVARTFRRSLAAAVGFALVAGTVLLFGFFPITSLWVRTAIDIAPLLLVGMATWCVIEAAGTALATLLNAAHVLRYQLVTSCVFALACIAGKAWVIAHGHVAWVPWITVVTYVAVNMVGLTLFRPAILSTLSRSGMPHSG